MFKIVAGVRFTVLLAILNSGSPDQSSFIKSNEGSCVSIVSICLVVMLTIYKCSYSSYFLRNDAESNLLIAM
jgi:hypothetical protein